MESKRDFFSVAQFSQQDRLKKEGDKYCFLITKTYTHPKNVPKTLKFTTLN